MNTYCPDSYSVIAHLFGELNAHHILVANTEDRAKALRLARSAHQHLNGHYGVAIYGWRDSSIYWLAEYIPSHLNEHAPADNPHIKALLRLGSYLRERVHTNPQDLPEDLVKLVKETESWTLFEELMKSRQFAVAPEVTKSQREQYFKELRDASKKIVEERMQHTQGSNNSEGE